MTARPAWRSNEAWTCSYCGRKLGIWGRSPLISFDHGWLIVDGRAEFRKPHRRMHFGSTANVVPPSIPFIAECRNPDCGEDVAVG